MTVGHSPAAPRPTPLSRRARRLQIPGITDEDRRIIREAMASGEVADLADQVLREEADFH